ncbi:ABC transporter permease [Streptomyces sp. PTM05]|uniref:ABC transporter permease n=1 Tax=Streptantibioticus parmotrematis TaxID=2873249 RepID=A0ABS7QLZ8_9ACTN|nr:ABC transporter permease [Streptantibioticus parmotrematis]MBY8884203.1 ABC transporter permease [Streptantibioticus parmotrematis]
MSAQDLLAGAAPSTAGEAAPAAGARQVWRRLRARKSALAGIVVIALLLLVAVCAPLLTAIEGQDPTTYHDSLLNSAAGGVPVGPFGGISGAHWLGVEPGSGRDLFARLVYGSQVSLLVAVGATLVEVVIGVVVGLAAGLGNKLLDQFLGHTTDVMLALPSLVFAIALMAVVPSGFPRPLLLTLVIGLLGWGGTARVVRAQTLTLKELDYVSAARLGGSSRWRIARRELLPSLAAPVITYAALLLPSNVASEAGLSFLGVGVKPPTSSWGQMLSSATTWFQSDPTYVLLPAAFLFVTTFAFTVVGDAVRTALDPRAASRLRVGTGRAKKRGNDTKRGNDAQRGNDTKRGGDAKQASADAKGAAA